MADTADTSIKDVGSRPVGYTIQTSNGAVINAQWDDETSASKVLSRMQSLTPPLLNDGRVVPVLGVIKERKGRPGRKPNAERAALAAQSNVPAPGNAKPEKAAVSANSMR